MESVFSIVLLIVFGGVLYFLGKSNPRLKPKLFFVAMLFVVAFAASIVFLLISLVAPMSETLSSIGVLAAMVGYWIWYRRKARGKGIFATSHSDDDHGDWKSV